MKKKRLLVKIVSAFMACIIMTSAVSYAETPETVASEAPRTYTVYDDDGNEYVLNEGEVLGVLRDKYGNVKEQCVISPYTSYLDGENKTLGPGDTFTTYQYKINSSFFAGFFYYYRNNNAPATTPGGYLAISLYECETIGGTRRAVKGGNFSTTYNPNIGVDDFLGDVSIGVEANLRLSSRPYYNAVFENVGTKTLNVCIYVGMN